jgi:hypothetical protein
MCCVLLLFIRVYHEVSTYISFEIHEVLIYISFCPDSELGVRGLLKNVSDL